MEEKKGEKETQKGEWGTRLEDRVGEGGRRRGNWRRRERARERSVLKRWMRGGMYE